MPSKQSCWERMSQPRQSNKLIKNNKKLTYVVATASICVCPGRKKKNKRIKRGTSNICIAKDFCPPRIDQLSMPTVPRLEGLLQTYDQILTPDCIIRVVNLIQNTLRAPPTSKDYASRQRKPKKPKLQKINKEIKELKWLRTQAEITAVLIMSYIAAQIEKLPNYRQIVLSEELLRTLKVTGSRKVVKRIRNYCEQFAVIADSEWEPYGDIDEDWQSELTVSELTHERRIIRHIVSEASLLEAGSELESLATIDEEAIGKLGNPTRFFKEDTNVILESDASTDDE